MIKKGTRNQAIENAKQLGFFNKRNQQLRADSIFARKEHIKGDIAESLAQNYFLHSGFKVFKNVSQHGLADFNILKQDGQSIYYDVKAISYKEYQSGLIGINSKPKTDLQKQYGVKIIYIDVDNNFIVDEH